MVAARQQRRADIVQATRNASRLHGASANCLQDARVPTVEIQAPQPIPQRPHVNVEFVGDPLERPAPLDHPVGQVALKSSKAKLGGPSGKTLVGGAAPMPGRHDRLGWPADARLGEKPTDDRDGGTQLASHLWQAGILLRSSRQVLVKVAVAVGAGALVQAALLTVQDGKAAADGERTGQTPC